MTSKIFFIFLYFLPLLSVLAQSYSPDITTSKLTIESVTYPGFRTFFDFDAKDVKKGWWKFSREFGKPVNMRKYYETTLIREDMENVKLISKSVKFGQGTRFYLTLNNKNIPGKLEQTYLDQVRKLLFEFKQEYYRSFLEGELKSLEKQAIKVTRQIDKARGDVEAEQKAFDDLKQINLSVDQVKDKIIRLQES